MMDGLWVKLMKNKYIQDLFMEYWIQTHSSVVKEASIVWKCLLKYFPLLGNWTTWKIGNGKKVKIKDDPWIGCVGYFKLTEAMKRSLMDQGVLNISDISLSGG
jgi:hypothetical protein